MSKLTIGLVIGLGVWGAGMGASSLSNASNEVLPSVSWTINLPFVKEVATKHKELPCVGDLFGEVEWNKAPGSAEIKALTSDGLEGCLSFWWDKETYGENWKGSLNLLWGMKDGSSGMVFLSNVRADGGKAVEDTILYTLKKSEENKWLSVSSTSGIPKSEIKNGSEIILPDQGLIDSSNEWNFDFNKICSSSGKCESEFPERTYSYLNWKFVSGIMPGKEEVSICKWIKNLEKLILIGGSLKTFLLNVKGYFQEV